MNIPSFSKLFQSFRAACLMKNVTQFFGSSFLAETFFPLQQTLEKTLLHPIFLMIHANIFDFWFLETQFSQDILPPRTDFLAYAVEMVYCYWLSVTAQQGYIATERFCLIGKGICLKKNIR